jgi:formylmethanofuran dehydrogenase subunit B
MKGVMDRELITIDVVDSELKKISRWFLQVNPGEDAEIADIMRRLVKGESLKEQLTGERDIDTLRKMADMLKKAFYGVIFVGLGVLSSENGSKSIEAILALVDALNKEGVKFVLFPMKPGKTTVLDVIARGEIDAALIIGADPFSSFPMTTARKLRDLPIILIDPFETPTTQFASVAIPTAITGVETEEIAYRMDGLPLKLEKIVDCEYPSDRRIYKGVKE